MKQNSISLTQGNVTVYMVTFPLLYVRKNLMV